MNTAKSIYFSVIFSFIIVVASDAHAMMTTTFIFDNVFLLNGDQLTGTFDWTYNMGDIEGGAASNIRNLGIPQSTVYTVANDNLIIEIQTNSITISGDGNFQDAGLEIKMTLSQPFASTHSVLIDRSIDPVTGTPASFFDCCGNSNVKQQFQSGSKISPAPVPEPSAIYLLLVGLAVIGSATHRKRSRGSLASFRSPSRE